MSSSPNICGICNTEDYHPIYVGYEMMFGTREEFEYFQCTSCGCLQIRHIPNDLGRFYPPNYYSLSISRDKKRSKLFDYLIKQRFRNALFNQGYKLNKIISKFIEMPYLCVDQVLLVTTILKQAEIKDFDAKFLDIGCGSWSTWLESLRIMGFHNLYGADPFIKSDLNEHGIIIYKKEISDIEGKFDLITMHHSLEHIPNQRNALISASNLLAPDGVILVRIPIVSSYVWEQYGTNWVEMDAPRHLYLHSRESIELLGKQVGLELYKYIPDSLDLEFYGSEQYSRNIPLTAPNSYWLNFDNQIFTPEEIDNFKNMAKRVNKENKAGRACFFFKKKNKTN
ncbi:class I SAM-dependent methyltransferase [Methylicorpusculum sp.]|uniref:class I SAM-dependent methyltransferase n=1 Tax=Methylicorpusculum sp. TaxID=2713644 RepID=UPI00272692E1|nr:class I SAM-dependent methyltransferase [Methylicorpusculum sp.]MDO8845977.1 class I SAM-dependent methyltransferase [Methylicorpusculum sp.]MDP2177106.1 class I SAM-dependent methyltransferase [Methylicorpusculum sp.]MDP3531248.1 class I SAM-dependent methyltransferase [Methylicorpusculum sp.]